MLKRCRTAHDPVSHPAVLHLIKLKSSALEFASNLIGNVFYVPPAETCVIILALFTFDYPLNFYATQVIQVMHLGEH